MSFRFKRAWAGPVLSRDQGLRQGMAVKSAVESLGSDDAKQFLNEHHDGLRGSPLEVAVASEAGLKAVQAAICIEARRAVQSC